MVSLNRHYPRTKLTSYSPEPALPTNISGKTFVAVLGTNTSPFEIFVLKRKIMGPCWIEIKDAVVSGKGVRHTCASSIDYRALMPSKQVSWCKLEVSSSDPKEIRPLTDADKPRETPPLTVMSISARTVVNHKENTREIVCASARVWENGGKLRPCTSSRLILLTLSPAPANIDNPTPPDQQISSIHTVVRPLGDFPPGFVQKCQTERSKINTVKSEGILLSNFIGAHRPDFQPGGLKMSLKPYSSSQHSTPRPRRADRARLSQCLARSPHAANGQTQDAQLVSRWTL
jgi:DNA polymerase alpha subunit A